MQILRITATHRAVQLGSDWSGAQSGITLASGKELMVILRSGADVASI
jgi:hypothetical protein